MFFFSSNFCLVFLPRRIFASLFAVIDHSNRPGVTFFLFASFLAACRRDADRNRGPGRVPGSPRNLSIRPTRSPPHRPPTYSFFASMCPLFAPVLPLSSLQFSSTAVLASIYARSFDSSLSFEFFLFSVSPLPSISFQPFHRRSFFIFVAIRSSFRVLSYCRTLFLPFPFVTDLTSRVSHNSSLLSRYFLSFPPPSLSSRTVTGPLRILLLESARKKSRRS